MASEAATSACQDFTTDQTVTIGFASVTQPAYAPSLIAIDTSDNIPMEATFFQQSELAMQALLQGEVDVLAIGVNGPMITISGGADLQIFGVTIGNDWTLVATQDIQEPADLEGKTIAIHSETSTGTPLVRGTLNDAGVNAEFVIIPGSPNRAQAMTQGQVDATPLFLSDAIRLERSDPERFHVLLDYGDVPFASQSLVAGTEWLDSNPELAQCLLEHFIETGRQMSDDPSATTDKLVSMFPDEDADYLGALVTEYVNRGLWVTDGGQALLSNFGEAVQTNIDLGTLAADAPSDAEAYTDTNALEAALQDLGG
jgi:NitT/TauT family transport system substrate-binding protein